MSIQRRVGPSPDRAAEVVRILGIANPSQEQVDRIRLFITLLGWDRVRLAAEYTAGRTGIVDPWHYVVGVINRNSARASYLYTLIHWIELALRGAIDCALSDRFAADWHRLDPPVYLHARGLGTLWKRHHDYVSQQAQRGYSIAGDQPQVAWRQDPVTQTWIPDYEGPEDFLAAIDFETLTEIALYTYEIRDPRAEPILFTPNGGQMPVQSARDELRWLRKFVRNYVAHNRPPELAALGKSVFDMNDYVSVATRTERVVVALRYNAPAALARHEQMRWAVVDEGVKRLGARGLKEVIATLAQG